MTNHDPESIREEDIPEDMLAPGENHPTSHVAFMFIKNFIQKDPLAAGILKDIFMETGSRQALLWYGTMKRIMSGQPVGERYLFALAWALRDIVDAGKDHEKP